MIVNITCKVSDEWRDWTHHSFILEGPYTDIHDALIGAGAEDIDIQGSPDDDTEDENS